MSTPEQKYLGNILQIPHSIEQVFIAQKMENTRPNRSDIHLSAEEEATIEAKTRDYFDGVAPQRHTKPQRSEYSAQYVDAFSNAHHSSLTIPELTQFQLLQNDPQEKVSSKYHLYFFLLHNFTFIE